MIHFCLPLGGRISPGFKLWADPLCIVGHEKVTELRG